MSWHFSQALEAEYLEENCLDGKPSAPWNSMPFAADDSCSGKMKDTCHRSPFGTMFVPSTDTLGEELLTWFRAGSPVRTFPQPEPVRDLTAHGLACGWKWQESSVKYDQPSALWKTRQCSLLGDSDVFSETWPAWGTMRNGECWGRQMWERHTSGTGSGLLPTPLASIATHGGPNQRDSSGRPGLQMAAMMWPTPNVPNGGRSVAHVTDWRGKSAYHNGKKVQFGLEAAVRMWPTPQAHDSTLGQAKRVGRYGTKHGARNLNDEAVASTEQPTGALNPPWVEWLMGWPIGWTGCEPLEMDKYHSAMPRLGVG